MSAGSVEVPAPVLMVSVRRECKASVEVPASAPAASGAVCARSVEVAASDPMGGSAERARCLAVEVPASETMRGSAASAGSAGGAGICKHGRIRSLCYHCNPNFAQSTAGCSNQCGNQLSPQAEVLSERRKPLLRLCDMYCARPVG